jgi:hypothetical protein
MKHLTVIERLLETNVEKDRNSQSFMQKNKDLIVNKISNRFFQTIVLSKDSIIEEDYSSDEDTKSPPMNPVCKFNIPRQIPHHRRSEEVKLDSICTD